MFDRAFNTPQQNGNTLKKQIKYEKYEIKCSRLLTGSTHKLN